jgi:DNA-binding Xre family transcriptional regulator
MLPTISALDAICVFLECILDDTEASMGKLMAYNRTISFR